MKETRLISRRGVPLGLKEWWRPILGNKSLEEASKAVVEMMLRSGQRWTDVCLNQRHGRTNPRVIEQRDPRELRNHTDSES